MNFQLSDLWYVGLQVEKFGFVLEIYYSSGCTISNRQVIWILYLRAHACVRTVVFI